MSTINAYMYMALTRWSELEKLLGDDEMSNKYGSLAIKLKSSYNKNIADGGFWDPSNKCYVHWREKDGKVFGSNLNCVVNFLSIGYGLCDNSESGLEYFNGTTDKLSLKICGRGMCSVNVVGWSDEKKIWQVTSGEQRMKIDHELYNLEPGRIYNIYFNGEKVRRIKADPEGIIRFKSYAGEKDVGVQIAAIN